MHCHILAEVWELPHCSTFVLINSSVRYDSIVVGDKWYWELERFNTMVSGPQYRHTIPVKYSVLK